MEFNVNFKRFMKFILHAFSRSETSINYKKNYATVGYSYLIGEKPKNNPIHYWIMIILYIIPMQVHFEYKIWKEPRCELFFSLNAFYTSSSYKSFGQFS